MDVIDFLREEQGLGPDDDIVDVMTTRTPTDKTIRFMQKYAMSEAKDFAAFLISDFDMDSFEDGKLCWNLCGTQLQYTTEEAYEAFKKLNG